MSLVVAVWYKMGIEIKIKWLYTHTYVPKFRNEIYPCVMCEKNGLGDWATWEGDIIRILGNSNSCTENDGNYVLELINNLELNNSKKCIFGGLIKRKIRDDEESFWLLSPIIMPWDSTGNEKMSVKVLFKPWSKKAIYHYFSCFLKDCGSRFSWFAFLPNSISSYCVTSG